MKDYYVNQETSTLLLERAVKIHLVENLNDTFQPNCSTAVLLRLNRHVVSCSIGTESEKCSDITWKR
jgi:hypothetical protein